MVAVLVAVACQHLLDDGGDDHALVGGAIEVAVAIIVVGVAAAAEGEGLGAVQGLLALLDGLASIGVVDVDGHVHRDAAKRVHDALEVIEVDLCVVGDGHAGELADDLNCIGGAAHRVGRIDLLLAVLAKIHQGVAVDRDQRHLLLLGIDAGQHDGVGAVVGRVLAVLRALCTLLGFIHAQKQHVERVICLHVGEGAAKLVVHALMEAVLDVGEIGPGDAAAGKDHAEHNDDGHANALVKAATLAGSRIVLYRALTGEILGFWLLSAAMLAQWKTPLGWKCWQRGHRRKTVGYIGGAGRKARVSQAYLKVSDLQGWAAHCT